MNPELAKAAANVDDGLRHAKRQVFLARWFMFCGFAYGVIAFINGWADDWNGLFFVAIGLTAILLTTNFITHHKAKRRIRTLRVLQKSILALDGLDDVDSIAFEHHYQQGLAAIRDL